MIDHTALFCRSCALWSGSFGLRAWFDFLPSFILLNCVMRKQEEQPTHQQKRNRASICNYFMLCNRWRSELAIERDWMPPHLASDRCILGALELQVPWCLRLLSDRLMSRLAI